MSAAWEAIPGVRLSKPTAHADRRGHLVEVFREQDLGTHFVQANHSRSREGVLRGLHHHRRQTDAWYVVSGRAQVGLADLRDPGSPPCVATVELTGDDPATLLVPPGVAHGFLALTDLDLIYWVTHPYDASDEFSVRWDDPLLQVPWARHDPVLSDRDATAPPLPQPVEGGSRIP
jgi:dTDP-4-dehydrorhamnose 3,5-epimerase